MNDQQANALFEQSISLLQQGKAQEALKILVKLDQAIPSNPGILFFTASGHSIAGNKRKAIQTYERVIRLNPQFIEAYNNIALDLAYLGEHLQAIDFIDHALKLRPDFIEALVNKGCCLNALGDLQLACQCFEDALQINPNSTEALANFAIALIRLGDYSKAQTLSEQILRLNPKDDKAHSNLGKICAALENFETSLIHCISANNHKPNNPDYLADLGNAYAKLGQQELAQQYFDQALTIDPNHGATELYLGLMHHDLRHFDQAISHFKSNTQDKYRAAQREYNCSLSQLHKGELKEGWSSYCRRWEEGHLSVSYLDTQRPLWNGQKTEAAVLLWHEQGIGDQILFGSMLNEAAERSSNLKVRLDSRLLPIFQRSFPSIRFIAHDAKLTDADFDYHLPFGDLGTIFRSERESFSSQANGYLKADASTSKHLRDSFPAEIPAIGLAWATKGKCSAERNLPIEEIVKTIQEITPTTFIDLQYSNTSADRSSISENLGINLRHIDEIDNFHDLDGFSGLITACDFVVTCSNSTAHLAGALGKETYLLVPFGRGRHWYWSHIGENGYSLWYPSIHIIPQNSAGDWSQPVQTLSNILKERQSCAA